MEGFPLVGTYVNVVSIILEAGGFVQMLRVTREAFQAGGGFDDGYRDTETRLPPDNVLYIKDKRRYLHGIYLVIIGLMGQIISTIFGLG